MATRRPFVIFVVLAIYIILQFGWWAYLIHRQGTIIHALEQGSQIGTYRNYSLWMILSEGGVFLLIVSVLLYLAFRAYHRELRLARAKDNFLMAVTHELRTPIAGMRLNMQTMQREGLQQDVRTQLLTNAITDTHRLQDLSDRILLAAKSDQEVIGVATEEIDISELTETLLIKCIQDFGKDHTIHSEVELGLLVFLDPIGYEFIIRNLVENAAKYSPKGSEIQVTLKKKSDNAILEVIDRGCGISQHDKKLVFDKFYRAGNENTRNNKGTGLGLFIVKRYTQRFGGSISVTDNATSGCTFRVILPLLE